MSAATKEAIEAAIKTYQEPHLGRDLIAAHALKDIVIEGDQVRVRVVLGFPARGAQEAIAAAVKDRVMAVAGVAGVQVDVSWEIKAHSVQKSLKPIDQVKNIIAVASGKGSWMVSSPNHAIRRSCVRIGAGSKPCMRRLPISFSCRAMANMPASADLATP